MAALICLNILIVVVFATKVLPATAKSILPRPYNSIKRSASLLESLLIPNWGSHRPSQFENTATRKSNIYLVAIVPRSTVTSDQQMQDYDENMFESLQTINENDGDHSAVLRVTKNPNLSLQYILLAKLADLFATNINKFANGNIESVPATIITPPQDTLRDIYTGNRKMNYKYERALNSLNRLLNRKLKIKRGLTVKRRNSDIYKIE